MQARILVLLVAGLLSVFVAACGGDGESEGGGGGGGGGESAESGTNTTANAPKAPAVPEQPPKGEVTFCLGKDTSGNQKAAAEEFNKEYGSQGLTMKLLEFPESADEQRNQFVQRQEAKSADCDFFYSDVIWTAEFASQGWLMDVSEYIETRKDDFIPATLKSVDFEDKYFGVPQQTDAAFLYYRTDKVDQAPETWQEVYEIAQQEGGIAYAGAPYEGLTCVYLELAFAAGGSVLNDDGTESTFDNPQNVEALQFMVDGIKNGAAPKAVTTFMEEPTRRSFEAGERAFQRQWPYSFALSNDAPKVKGKFEVAPLPTWEGGKSASILGGHNLVVSAFSKNPEATMFAIDYLTSPEVFKRNAAEFSLLPTMAETYDDPDVQKALPFAEEARQAVEQAEVRPVSPVYPQISQAIYKNVNSALAGRMSAEEAVKAAHEEINSALQTF
jgi:multiple sugar transport system substrate-binding protein